MQAKNLISHGFALLALTLSINATAGGIQPFDKAEFEKAQSAGKSVALHFHADWCPTCKKQAPILKEILGEKEFAGMVGFTADYDKEKELKKMMKVSKQSTIVVFKGTKEIVQSTGVTSKDDIKSLLSKGL